MTPLIIFGAGMQGDMFADWIAWEFMDRYTIVGFLDDQKRVGTSGPSGIRILGSLQQGAALLKEHQAEFLLALGTRAAKRKLQLFRELNREGFIPASLISPRALISPSAKLGAQAIVSPGVFLGSHVHIGDLFTAYAGAVVEHHGQIANHVLLGPNATLAGGAQVSSHSFIGAGATVSAGAQVGKGCLVGAGAVVVRSIANWHVAVGVPARECRMTRAGDEVLLRSEAESLA